MLLAQIGSEYGVTRAPLQAQDLLDRAEGVLQEADKLGCRKFLTPKSLVAGNPKLNLAFVANLFNNHPALDPITEEEKLEVEDFDAEGEREARVFTLWLNSLDVQPSVQSFFDDLRDGIILLQAYDKVVPGSVNTRHVNKRRTDGGELMRFKAVENTNYAIELGKQIGFSLVGIQGADITDGQRTLTLGLVWQLMRRDITVTLSSLAQKLGKREITDAEMVRWANDMSKKGGRGSAIRSFKDPSIGTGVFLLDVLSGMKSSYVDYDLVTPGHTDDDAYLNAKLSISIARKLGATIWLVPEDICQVRSRLVTTFIGKSFLVCLDDGFNVVSRISYGDLREDVDYCEIVFRIVLLWCWHTNKSRFYIQWPASSNLCLSGIVFTKPSHFFATLTSKTRTSIVRCYRIKYRLQRRLGPVKIPSQNMKFPNVFRPRSHLVRLSFTNYPNSQINSPQGGVAKGDILVIDTSGGSGDSL